MITLKRSLLGAAIVAVLASSNASALSPAGPFAINLTVSGASAFEGAIESELSSATSSICTSGTYNKFVSNTNDFRAYTCTLKAGVSSTTGGEAAAIYYRGEGGSIWGVTPLIGTAPTTRFNGAAIPKPLRLNLASCPTSVTPGATATVTCTIAGYNAVADTATSGLVSDISDVGFADVEPNQFFGENYPVASLFATVQPALNAAERTALTTSSQAVVAQAFIVQTQNLPTANGGNAAQNQLAALTTLSKSILSGIVRGQFSDWSLVPNGTGGTVTTDSLPIKLCRREAGSGTQIAASFFFNNFALTGQAYASTASPGNLDPGSAGGGGVVESASSGGVRTCLQNGFAPDGTTPVGGIGVLSSEADVAPSGTTAGRHSIKIDGQGNPGSNDLSDFISDGRYDFWFEEVAIKSPVLVANAPDTKLADKLISVTQKQATGPTTPNVAFLSPLNAATYPLVAPPAGKKQISCLRRNKVSTSVPAWQC